MTRWLSCFCALALAACTTTPITGRSQLHLVSEQSAIAQSTSAYNAMMADYSQHNKLITDKRILQRIRGITDKLIEQGVRLYPPARGWQWRIEVIDDAKTVNAFCMAGGRMAVYTGLLDQVKPTDDELAQVLGHEIGHALAGHAAEKMSMKMASDFGAAVFSAATGLPSNAGSFGAQALISLPNSREAESEADRIGIELAARAGFNPQAAITLWQKMMAATGSSSRMDFLSTHPASPKRIDALRALEAEMQPLYRAAQNNPPPRAWTAMAQSDDIPVGQP